MPSARSWGPYRALRRLGEGGMGTVWEVEHVTTGARYALKELLSSVALDLDDRQRFAREGELLAGLVHPHLVRVHAAELSGPTPFVVQELLGESLADRIRARGPLPLPEVERLARELAAGLAHAHAQGVIHRDIKPDNVLFDAEGRAKLGDFGLALRVADDRTRLTETGTIMGTPVYMAPEQALDAKQAGPPADVYAWGAVLYAALTGRPPISGDGGLLATLARIQEQRPAPIQELRPDAPAWLTELSERCLAKAPGERPTAPELEERLALAEPVGARDARRTVALTGLGVALGLAATAALLATRGADPGPAPEASSSPSSPAATRRASRVTPSASPTPTREAPELTYLRQSSPDRARDTLVRFTVAGDLLAFDARLTLSRWSRREGTWNPIGQQRLGDRPQRRACPTVLVPGPRQGWVFGCGKVYGESGGGRLRDAAGPWPGREEPTAGLLVEDRLWIGTREGQLSCCDFAHRRLLNRTALDDWITALAPAGPDRLLVLTRGDLAGALHLARTRRDGSVELVFSVPVGSGTCLAVHPSGRWCVVGATTSTLQIVALEAARLRLGGFALGRDRDLTLQQAHRGAIYACAFAPDGSSLFSSATGERGENDLKAWRVTRGPRLEEVARLQLGEHELPFSLAVSSTGQVAVGTREGAVLLAGPLGTWR